MSALAVILTRPWAIKAALVGVVILAALLILARARRAGERIAEVRLKLENAHAVAAARKKMDEVPRPSRDDVVRGLRDGTF